MPRKKSTETESTGTINTETESTESKWEKRFVLVFKDETIFDQFQTLCHVAETDPSKFLIDYVNRVVADNQALIKAHSENKNKIKL